MAKKPSAAFVAAGWAALTVFAGTYAVSLWRMDIPVIEAYFYVTIVLFGLFGVVSVVKSVRDKEDGIPVTGLFYGLAWVATIAPITIMSIYLLQISTLDELQRGFLFLTFVACVFAVVVVQKNTRDLQDWNNWDRPMKKSVDPASDLLG